MVYREALMWKWLKHPNIVPFRGVTLEPLQILSEWMSNGDLTVYIKQNPDASRVTLVRPPFSPSKQHHLIVHQLFDVAKGLDYLHNCDVVHGDLKGVYVSSLSNLVASLIDACSQISWLMLPAAHA